MVYLTETVLFEMKYEWPISLYSIAAFSFVSIRPHDSAQGKVAMTPGPLCRCGERLPSKMLLTTPLQMVLRPTAVATTSEFRVRSSSP